MQGKRLERVNQLIKEEVSTLLQRELRDPRLGFVTVTEVAVTPDLKYAKVYVSVLGAEDRWASTFLALDSARGFVRNWLRRHLDLRVTPEIRGLILHSSFAGEIQDVARKQGMKTLREAGIQKVLEGVTTVEEVLRVTTD